MFENISMYLSIRFRFNVKLSEFATVVKKSLFQGGNLQFFPSGSGKLWTLPTTF